MYKTFVTFFFLIFVFSCKTEKNTSALLPKNVNQDVVYDLSHIFSKSEALLLKQKIIDYERASTNEIAILTVDSITPYNNIQKFGTDVANLWGVGKKDSNNGLLIVICKPCRNVSICTGYGTEKILTDSICKVIIDSTLVPSFKKEAYYNGVKNALDSIISKWH